MSPGHRSEVPESSPVSKISIALVQMSNLQPLFLPQFHSGRNTPTSSKHMQQPGTQSLHLETRYSYTSTLRYRLYFLYKSLRITSPLHQHIPYRAPVLRGDKRLNLSLSQPLELLVAENTLANISLASHDARLHEEDFLAELLLLVGVCESCLAGIAVGLVVRELANGRLGVVVVVVGDGVVADDPGVHVEASRLDDDALGGLGKRLV
jgi:hypothetical protein